MPIVRCVRVYPCSSLPFRETHGAPCVSTNSSNYVATNSTVLQLDTGLLNSNADFGINSGERDQIDCRRVTSCSPIHVAPFETILGASDPK